ncbi:MAG: efflux RND transporter periplasmic adaptor subunit [Bacteroidales bacterium]|nr:efflux RND transporter periplasmic adaptor subunit [Bacteroidales bacterium]
MKTKDIKKYGIFSLIFVVGIFLGALIWSGGDQDEKLQETSGHEHSEAEDTEYTCSMHPEVRQSEPGDCPICGMELIPVKDESSEGSNVQDFEMTEAAMKLAQVRTSQVEKGNRSKKIFLEGKIAADQRKVYSQVIHFSGRLEELFVNFDGQEVRKGQKIATVYSPDLIAAQRELLETAGSEYGNDDMLEAAREKLKQWKISEDQIQHILKTKKVKTNFDIKADVSGYVTQMNISKGDYIRQGSVLFKIADLSSVWVMLDAYERDLQWLKKGQRMNLQVEAYPGQDFSGTITYLDPFVDESSRVIDVRVELNNTRNKLKPGMFATGNINAQKGGEKVLLIPETAVLWTGRRSVVYVQNKDNKHVFRMREITTGHETGDMIMVLDGLKEGEHVISNGTFAVDAAAQLAGKVSMMNPGIAGKENNTSDLVQEGETAGVVESTHSEIEKTDVSDKFQQQLTSFYSDYIRMKNSFVATDAKAVKKHANQLQQSLGNIDMGLLEGEAHMKWMEYLEVIKRDLETIAGSSDIEKQRKAFVTFNPPFYKALKTFGLSGEDAYYQFCPMANDDKGAYWISEQKEIRNPYFGDEMMECGENKSEINGE